VLYSLDDHRRGLVQGGYRLYPAAIPAKAKPVESHEERQAEGYTSSQTQEYYGDQRSFHALAWRPRVALD